MVETDVIMRYIRVFSELAGQIKHASNKRVLIEIALIKLNKPQMENDTATLINRISIFGKQNGKGGFCGKGSGACN
ncbi:MAG: hypothetical protein V8R90_04910 [Eubacterium sp.]